MGALRVVFDTNIFSGETVDALKAGPMLKLFQSGRLPEGLRAWAMAEWTS